MIRSFRNKDSQGLYEGKRVPWLESSKMTIKEHYMQNNMRPIHPGEILADEMKDIGLSANQLAKQLKVPANRMTTIINGERNITADTALRLARYFGSSAEFWMNLQSTYDLKVAQAKKRDIIESQVQPRAG